MADEAINSVAKRNKAERTCGGCGCAAPGLTGRAMFCSNRCKKRSYRHKARHVAKKECRMCGGMFDASGRRHRRVVCSDSCWRAWDRLQHARRSKRPVSLIGPPIPMACTECGAKHINKNGRDGYCSKSCKSRAYAKSDAGQAYKKAFAETGYYREYARRRAAERALSLLLLPAQQPPQV